MPRQRLFLKRQIGERRVEVIKTYDKSFAREAFDNMDESAQTRLWQSLGVDESYDLDEVPAAASLDRADFLWEEVLDSAREDWKLLSFFVVSERNGGKSENLYVSPDWPSAEAFLKMQMGKLSGVS